MPFHYKGQNLLMSACRTSNKPHMVRAVFSIHHNISHTHNTCSTNSHFSTSLWLPYPSRVHNKREMEQLQKLQSTYNTPTFKLLYTLLLDTFHKTKIHKDDLIQRTGKHSVFNLQKLVTKCLSSKLTHKADGNLTKCGIEEQGSLCHTLQAHESNC